MLPLITTALSLVSEIAPLITTSTAVAKAIQVLNVAVPALIQTGRDLVPVAKMGIDALRGNAATTPEQLAELDELEKKLDADYDAASAAAAAEDAQADQKSPGG